MLHRKISELNYSFLELQILQTWLACFKHVTSTFYTYIFCHTILFSSADVKPFTNIFRTFKTGSFFFLLEITCTGACFI